MSRYVCRCCVSTVPCTLDDGVHIPWELSKPELCPFNVGTPRWELEG